MTNEELQAELAELDAIAKALLKRIAKMRERLASPPPVVDREPPPEAYARVMARRRRQGR